MMPSVPVTIVGGGGGGGGEGDLEAAQQGFSDKPGPEFMALALNYFINFIHTHQVLSLVHLPSPIYSAVAFFSYMFCFVLLCN